MVILHIGRISNDFFNGVCVVVPQYIHYQSKHAEVALWNLSNDFNDAVYNHFHYSEYKEIYNLPEPFSKPDIVVFHEVYKKEYLAIYKQLLNNNIPYIIVPHGSLTSGAQKKKFLKKKIANILLFNSFLKSAKGLQLLSKLEYEETKFNNDKFIVTNGVSDRSRVKEHFSENDITITYIGRLDVYHKGIDILIKSVASIKEFLVSNNVRINIYGPDIKNRLNMIRKLLKEYDTGDIISLNKEVSGKEKEDILLDSTYFIQTSRFEGMPLGILEAMSYGIPCIITEGTNLGDFVKKYDSGWVSETDSNSLADIIKTAISEKTLLPIKSNNAIKLCINNFSWETISNNAINIYNSIIVQED